MSKQTLTNSSNRKKVKIIEPANENNKLSEEDTQTRVPKNKNRTIMQQHKQIPHHNLNQNGNNKASTIDEKPAAPQYDEYDDNPIVKQMQKMSGVLELSHENEDDAASKIAEKNAPKTALIVQDHIRSHLHIHGQHSDIPFVIGASIVENTNGLFGKILIGLSWVLMVIFFPFSLFTTLKVVQEYERAVIFRLGRLHKGGAKGPGLFVVLPCIETYSKVDMRTVSFDVPPQEVLTKDSVTVAVDAVVYYRVFNPVISIANVENAQESTRLLAQTSLRNVLGTISLAEILSNREAVSSCMREILDDATDQWGIKVERVEIKDVRLPIQLQRAMAAEAEATREAKAKVIAAEGEFKAAAALKEAADILSESKSAIQLRYLQTLSNIAGEKNSTIVFPLPIELMTHLISSSSKSQTKLYRQPNSSTVKSITSKNELIVKQKNVDLKFSKQQKQLAIAPDIDEQEQDDVEIEGDNLSSNLESDLDNDFNETVALKTTKSSSQYDDFDERVKYLTDMTDI